MPFYAVSLHRTYPRRRKASSIYDKNLYDITKDVVNTKASKKKLEDLLLILNIVNCVLIIGAHFFFKYIVQIFGLLMYWLVLAVHICIYYMFRYNSLTLFLCIY